MLKLSKDNFELYASQHYSAGKWSTTEEFKGDFARFNYVNRLINRYYRDDDLKERLILNHLVILGNMFGPSETAKMAMFNIKEEQKPVLKTFLIYLNYLPEDKNIGTPLDSNIIEKLRNI
jgi:hypothetical protein